MEVRCRLCAELTSDHIQILDDVLLQTRIYQLFQVKITPEDKLPLTVCQLCCETVNHTWEFSQHVQKSQELLSDIISEECKMDIVENKFQTQKELDNNDEPPAGPLNNCPNDNDDNNSTLLKANENIKPLKEPKVSDIEESVNSATPVTVTFGWESYPWKCCDCNEKFNTSEELRDHHVNVHSQAVKYECVDCSKLYYKYNTFISHVKVHRTKLKNCCDICFQWFPFLKILEKHRNEHNYGRPFSCITCGKRFRMQSALVVHNRSHLPAELKNKYQCDECPKRFGTKPNLMAHKRIHAGIKEYTCDQCGKSFVQKGNLDNHLLTHTAIRPFNCNNCGKSFKTLIRLKKHETVHSGLKPHQCDVCGRQFRERGTLKEHHRIHTGAMPFTCEFCGKNFRFKGVLTTHRRQHTGERPYSCQECQHHFTNWPNYNKHMKRRHGINTSVTVRKPQTIPPTGMPHRNPPGTVLAPPTPAPVPLIMDTYHVEQAPAFYPVLDLEKGRIMELEMQTIF